MSEVMSPGLPWYRGETQRYQLCLEQALCRWNQQQCNWISHFNHNYAAVTLVCADCRSLKEQLRLHRRIGSYIFHTIIIFFLLILTHNCNQHMPVCYLSRMWMAKNSKSCTRMEVGPILWSTRIHLSRSTIRMYNFTK